MPLDIARIATGYGMGVFSYVVGSTHPKLNSQNFISDTCMFKLLKTDHIRDVLSRFLSL